MKIVIIGGHLSPALAVLEKLRNEKVYFLGRKYVFEGDKTLSLEYQEIRKLKIPFFPITSSRLQRAFTRHTVSSISKFPIGLSQSIKILNKIKPDVILGFGGYVSLPVIISAFILKIPVVIHEQTLEAGFANKLASKFAKKICISWESSNKFFPKEKIVLTGNPLRKEILTGKKRKKERKDKKIIYITGGSSGSHFINVMIENTLDKLLKDYFIIHQVGDSKYQDYQRLNEKKKKLNKDFSKSYVLAKHFSAKETVKIINNSDLVIGRAGINTITELIYLEKPALLIPLPVAQKNEQLNNSKFLRTLGLGDFMIQKHINENNFYSKVRFMLNNIEMYQLKQHVLVENPADKIIAVLKNVSTKKKA